MVTSFAGITEHSNLSYMHSRLHVQKCVFRIWPGKEIILFADSVGNQLFQHNICKGDNILAWFQIWATT